MKKIQILLFMILSFFTGVIITRHSAAKIIYKEHNELKKNVCLFRFVNEWLILKQKKKDLSEYFKINGYYSIAIYGMGYLGQRLVDELRTSNISIRYAIDKYKKDGYEGIEMKDIREKLPEVDAVIVTPIYDFWKIKQCLTDKFVCPVISLENVVCEY